MSRRIRRASLLLLLILVCSQGFAGGERSGPGGRRQKRGIMKMMMHIMWDPVRLIRYWYAYDVTKEIAKSWRKILPTMMLLPFNPNLADTPGIAKYVHPTHGLKYHKNTKQFTYPAISSKETYSASQFPKDYLVSDQNAFAHFQPGSGIVLEGPHQKPSESSTKYHKQFASSGETYSGSQFPKDYLISDPNAFAHFQPGSGIVFEGSHQKPSESSDSEAVPLVFQQGQQLGGSRHVHVSSFPVNAQEVDGSNEQQQHRIVLKPVPVEGFFHSPSSDSQELVAFPAPYKINLLNSRGENDEIHDASKEKSEGDVVPSSSNSDSKRTKNKYFKYPEAGQQSYVRFHHPEHHSQVTAYEDRPPTQHVIHTGHQELHIVLHPIPFGHVGPSDGGKALHFVPVSFNASESSHPFASPAGVATRVPQGQDDELYPSNNASEKNEANASSSETSVGADGNGKSSRVTWVLKQQDSSSQTDRRTADNDPDDSVPQVSSLSYQDGKSPQGLRLNGQSIDLVQLKEDLRHGTPVLIPFHHKKEKTYSSPDKSVFVPNSSAEQYDARNSTQRLLFFFKRP